MKNRATRLLLAALVLPALLLSGCGREREPREGLTLSPREEAPSEATSEPKLPEEGVLDIQQPTATAVPAPRGESLAERRIDPEGKLIALSFDDGPGPGTRSILDALTQVNGRATFCMVGERLGNYAETAKQVANQGSEIATHTWDHAELTRLDAARVCRELKDSLDAIEAVAGVRPGLLRPPYGSVNEDVKESCRELGLAIANWNIDPEDWRTRDAADIREHVLSRAKDGAIVLCHDLYPETAEAMRGVIRELDARGYQLVTVSELLDARAGGAEPGEVYYSA